MSQSFFRRWRSPFSLYALYVCETIPSEQQKTHLCDDIHCLDVSQERADYDRIDQEADEWRAKQIAKDIAKRKVRSHFCEILFQC
jgi:hypothetical protein